MTTTVKNIIPRKAAEAAQTIQYTATECTTVIDKFTVTNTSANNASFNCNLVAVDGTATDANLILKSRVIAPNETYTCPELVGQVLLAGGTISTLCGAAGALTISASGREII